MSALLVASTGGHLAQLVRLRPRLTGLGDDVTWITFDTPQSRSMLSGEDVVFVRHTASRDYAAVAANTVRAARLLRDPRITTVVSTGSGIALSFFPLARAHGLDCHFIESSARSDAPSLTGRLLRWLPGMRLYSQYPEWAEAPWRYAGSVFDGFSAADRGPTALRRVVVLLGTIKFPFRRLVDRLAQILPPDSEVLWQTGATGVSDLGLTARAQIPEHELRAAVRDADVVIAHAGVGSALTALESGRLPILVPRLARFGEHIDDHQLQIAAHLERRGLALNRSPDALATADLESAAALEVSQAPPAPFQLAAGPPRTLPRLAASLAAVLPRRDGV